MGRESMLLAAWRLNRGAPLLIAGLLLLNVIAYLLMSYVVAPGIDALERRYIARQATARQARQPGSVDGSPQEVYRRAQEDLETFRAAIPPRTEFTALIGEVFALAEEAGLGIDRIGYDPKEVAGKGLLRYGLNFSVTGRYGQIKKFIYALEQSKRLMAIEELSLSGEPQAGGVSLRVRLSTYFSTDAP